jgi:hypothetical protein
MLYQRYTQVLSSIGELQNRQNDHFTIIDSAQPHIGVSLANQGNGESPIMMISLPRAQVITGLTLAVRIAIRALGG